MGYKKIGLILFINFAIAFGFFYDNLYSNFTDISSDLANIIPICKKLDNPDLYKNDLYLNDINDVKYYTPFYVESLRAMSLLTGGNYIQALNLLSFVMHLLYGITWFFLFYLLCKDFWLALIFSVFFRGTLWPPGSELLGISGLWSAVPRTLFIAVAPLPFLTYSVLKKYRMVFSALLLGLILNFHPISGVGVIVCYFSIFSLYSYYIKGFDSVFYKDFAIAVALCLLGMLPYLLTYLLNVKVDVLVSQDIFNLAFKQRLNFDALSDPMLFFPQWKQPTLIFLAPAFAGYFFIDRSPNKRNFKILFFTMVIVFIAANGFVYLENGINRLFNKNIRMAFQLIRFQKFVLVLLQIGLYLFIVEVFNRYAIKEIYKKMIAVVFVFVLSFSTSPLLSKLPLVGDDLITFIFPDSLKFYKPEKTKDKEDLSDMIAYIKQNTEVDAVFYNGCMRTAGSVFYNNCEIRAGADRAVVLDINGAGMLIEGNRDKFVQWYLDTKKLDALDIPGKILFLKSKKINYLVSDVEWETLVPVKKIGKFYLYKIQKEEFDL